MTDGTLTYEEASKIPLPFRMWEVRWRYDASGNLKERFVSHILVTRVGIAHSLGATMPSISFIEYPERRQCIGSIENYFSTKEAAMIALEEEVDQE